MNLPTTIDMPDNRWARRGLSVLAGFMVCFAMPPWGWWPFALFGVGLWALLLKDRTWKQRYWVGTMVGLGWYLPSTVWMVKMTPAGWPFGVAIWFPFVFGVLSMMCPPKATLFTLPSAIVLGEWFRWHAPFGGVPLSMLAYTQARGPLLPVARIGGTLMVSGAVAVLGCGLAALVQQNTRKLGAITVAGVAIVSLLGVVAPQGKAIKTINAAAIQGGGKQETRSTGNESAEVFARHIDAAELVTMPVDLVLFPENITNISGEYRGSYEEQSLTAVATRLDATIVAGIVEDRNDPDHFWNFAIAISPKGEFEGRYDKVRRVPYGEYVPMRNLLEPFAGDVLPPRDDREGTGPAIINTSLGKLGVVISWETFFPRRVRESLNNDAEIVLNPTNGSSYWLTQVQTQQIASSTLRAVESGRWVIQAAPTGFSAFINPAGDVEQRSGIGEQNVLQQDVELRQGRTLAIIWGEAPELLASLLALSWAWIGYLRSRAKCQETEISPTAAA